MNRTTPVLHKLIWSLSKIKAAEGSLRAIYPRVHDMMCNMLFPLEGENHLSSRVSCSRFEFKVIVISVMRKSKNASDKRGVVHGAMSEQAHFNHHTNEM